MNEFKTLIPFENLEYEAQSQIMKNLYLPFMVKLVIMPDCHTGYSLPIGGVALLDSIISPPYVGFDQGCGICSVKTGLKFSELSKHQKWDIYYKILQKIPVRRNSRKRSGEFPYGEFKSTIEDKNLDNFVNSKLNKQFGTLGSGNHFAEVGKDLDDYLCITIHSGSRKPGWLVGDFYMKLSNNVDNDLPKGFLHLNGHYGQCFLNDMNYMLNYALENRKLMMKIILEIIGFEDNRINSYLNDIMINENHNHAVPKDNNLVLHRKGATPADKGQLGIIPGNMRDGVYITVGLGNEEYLSSSSHGAGRLKSRTKAKQDLSFDKMKADMKDKISVIRENILDESADAYKNLNDVIKMQEGIVIETVNKITSEINVKG